MELDLVFDAVTCAYQNVFIFSGVVIICSGYGVGEGVLHPLICYCHHWHPRR